MLCVILVCVYPCVLFLYIHVCFHDNMLYLYVCICVILVGVYNEVQQMKQACGSVHMKTILATGELGTLTNVYKASMVCMMAG